MKIDYIKKDKLLLVQFNEEIDHHTTEKMKRRVDYEIERFMPRKIVFDFSCVTFMDSAGIGMLIGRYKLARVFGGKLELKNVSLGIKKILEICGVLKLIPIAEDTENSNNEKRKEVYYGNI